MHDHWVFTITMFRQPQNSTSQTIANIQNQHQTMYLNSPFYILFINQLSHLQQVFQLFSLLTHNHYFSIEKKIQKLNMKSQRAQLQNIYVSPKNKDTTLLRKIYLNGGLLSKTSRNQQSKNSAEAIKQLHFKKKLSKLKSSFSQEKFSYSERKNSQKQNTMKREASLNQKAFKERSIIFKSNTKHSNNSSRVHSSTSRLSKLQKTQKSTMISEIECAAKRMEKMKENKKEHQMGKNCRVVIIQGTTEQEHYVVVDKIGDVMKYLTNEYPRYRYYKSIPNQLTIDYFLMEGKIDGKFLNGQSLYLKPAGRVSNASIGEYPSEIGLQSFQIIRLIGSGGFSKVFLCRYKEDGQFYAMKVIDKQIIVKNKKKKIIMNQRNIMKGASHPFVIDMKFAFQSEKYLVFVMEYCAGGQLFGLIKKYRRISEQMARFYIIQIFLGLQYLHQKQVVYRDIKPENILLCLDGHVKIADLGLAKPEMHDGQLAYSFCGSPQYMSPEMILQVGHTYPVDYYCMGALLYELLTGLPPYYSRDPNQIYEAVLSQELTFPPDVSLTPECKGLLKGLLCKQPKQRLGSIHGIKQILVHPWFGKNLYKKFINKQVEPPTNFLSIGKVNLDDYSNEQKNKKQVQQVKKQQKIQRKKFKQVMRGFYFDYRQNNLPQQRYDSKQHTEKSEQSKPKQLNFRRKSSSKKKITQLSSRQHKKQNQVPKDFVTNFNVESEQNRILNANYTNKNSLKKLTNNHSSKRNLFKHKMNDTPSASSAVNLKNILNSQRY